MKFFLSFTFTFSLFCMSNMIIAQDASELPYYQIPDYPEKYTAETVAARMVDGLGYRYYWATEGLTEENLAFKPSEKGRTIDETLDHILGLTNTLANAAKKQPNIRSGEKKELTFDEKRRKTLENIKTASDILRSAKEGEIEEFLVIFQRGEQTSEYPFWNMLNGPLADALWHVGQVVSHRRTAGNPLNPKVSVFRGKNRE